jgi:RNA polymerase-binding transcription factor DksA
MSNASVIRYSDEELEEFKRVIQEKLSQAKTELDDLRGQILDITESLEGDFGNDYMDDSSVVTDLEMLNNMAIRKRKYIQDLENALIRIKNKTYGICTITGELIDKKRLLAVPTTTKSLQGKALEHAPQQKTETAETEEEETPKAKPAPPTQGKIITRVIRKPTSPKPAPAVEDEDEDEFDEDAYIPDLKRLNVDDVEDDIEDEGSGDFDEGYSEDNGGDEGEED